MTAKQQPTVHDMKTIQDMARPPGAPRLTKDGVDLDVIASEGIRRDAERDLERVREDVSEVTPRLDAVLYVVDARKRARLAAAALEDVLGAQHEGPIDALKKIHQARALLLGAAEALAIFEGER